MTAAPECLLCRGPAGDGELDRIEVWRDELWRLTVSVAAEVEGFAYLEPFRHIRWITELDGAEARTFGDVMARVTSALKAATGAGVVYVYVFGSGIPHLHVHLAPPHEGDALSDQLIKGNIVEEKLPSGITRLVSDAFPPLPEERLRHVASLVQKALQIQLPEE